MVAIGHIYSNKTVFNWLYSFHMPLFFLVAGWVYRQKPVLTDMKHRIQTIVIPYFSFGLLVLIYWQLIERKFRDSDMGFADSILGLFSGVYDNLDFNVHLWFLPCFFLTVVLFNILVNVGGKKIAYIVSALMSIIFIVVPLPVMLWGFDRVFKYIGFYAIGALLSDRKANRVVHRKPAMVITAAGLLVINFILSYFGWTIGVMWFISALIGVAGVTILSVMVDKCTVLQYLGRISLVILCIHGPVYRIIVKLISIPLHMGTDAVRENFILAMIVVVLTLVVCSIAYEVIRRICPWMIGKRVGKLH